MGEYICHTITVVWGGVDNLPNKITITIPENRLNVTDIFKNGYKGNSLTESITVNTGIDLSKYTVSGATVSGSNIIASRVFTVKEISQTYIEIHAPAITVTATKK